MFIPHITIGYYPTGRNKILIGINNFVALGKILYIPIGYIKETKMVLYITHTTLTECRCRATFMILYFFALNETKWQKEKEEEKIFILFFFFSFQLGRYYFHHNIFH